MSSDEIDKFMYDQWTSLCTTEKCLMRCIRAACDMQAGKGGKIEMACRTIQKFCEPRQGQLRTITGVR